MKGIILAGGTGSRLFPITKATSKQLLPIYDKPMIYYPLATLLYAGVRDILLITNEIDVPRFHALLDDGSRFGVTISYAVQEEPKGIAEAFLIAESFIGNDAVVLVLGDNIFHGPNMGTLFGTIQSLSSGGMVFGYEVSDPERYGVLEFDEQNRVVDIIEKPKKAPSPFAVTGLYAYDNDVVAIAKGLKPSDRGELEITDINAQYLRKGMLKVTFLDRGYAWLDTGTYDALQHAASYVQTIQERQGIQIACLEEIAFHLGLIDEEALESAAREYGSSSYGLYIDKLRQRSQKQIFV